jgi:hypothetical protein
LTAVLATHVLTTFFIICFWHVPISDLASLADAFDLGIDLAIFCFDLAIDRSRVSGRSATTNASRSLRTIASDTR